MMNIKNELSFKYLRKVHVAKSTHNTIRQKHISALLLDIAGIGYTLSGDLISAIKTLNTQDFKSFHSILVDHLSNIVGTNVKYIPLFRNFPDDVPDDMEYLFKRIIGSLTSDLGIKDDNSTILECGHIISSDLFKIEDFGACPICQFQSDKLTDNATNQQPNIKNIQDFTNLEIIGLCSESESNNLIKRLIYSNVALAGREMDTISNILIEDEQLLFSLNDIIPNRENLSTVLFAAVKTLDEKKAVSFIKRFVNSATDILRLATILSYGDTSLRSNVNYTLNRKQRRIIMDLLNSFNSIQEDMLRHRNKWIRLGEVIHTGEYKNRFPHAVEAFDVLRNKPNTIQSFNKNLDKLLKAVYNKSESDQIKLLKLLTSRPGEFVRKIDFMTRNFNDRNFKKMLNSLENIGELTATTILLTTAFHIKSRKNKLPNRSVTVNNNIHLFKEDTRDVIKYDRIESVVDLIEKILINRFSKKESLGDVYIDEKLKKYKVPLVQRDTSDAIKLLARGSRININHIKSPRLYVYWKQLDSDVDIDLSVISYSESWEYKGHLSYTKYSSDFGEHSGDIQSAPNGASEFIDINIDNAIKTGIRYIIMNVIVYSGDTFKDCERVLAGVTEATDDSAEDMMNSISVDMLTTKFEINRSSKYSQPLIFDIKNKDFVWVDGSMKISKLSSSESMIRMVSDNAKSAIVNSEILPDIYTLLQLHAKARAKSVNKELDINKKYDIIYDEDFASKFDIISEDYLN